MTKLGDIINIVDNIKVAPFNVIKLFNKLIFENEGDRTCRKKVREFTGFTFKSGSEEYKAKLAYITDNFNKSDLTSISNIIRVDYNVTEAELIKNICANLMDLQQLKENSEKGDDNEEDEEDDQEDEEDEQAEKEDNVSFTNSNLSRPPAFAMSFRDVEESIRTFDGSSSYPVEKWISDFEDTAKLLSWGELHTFIFAKKSLNGLAKLFIQSESGVNSWKLLKKALLKEFSSKLNSAQVHQLLVKRKMDKKETVQEYFLVMKDLASRGDVEADALMQYVIDGIVDDANNKFILYGSSNLDEFKKKLKIYGDIKSRGEVKGLSYQKDTVPKDEMKIKVDAKTGNPIRCYNCGMQGHRSVNCKSKSLGTKCFKCNGYGHKSFECQSGSSKQIPQDKSSSTKNVNRVSSNITDNMYKTTTINENQIEMLVDTGSHVNIIKEDTYKTIGSPTLYKTELILNGFGKSKIKTMGYFQNAIEIDNDRFDTMFYVVPNDVMIMKGIIGHDLLNQADVMISQNGIKITKRQDDIFLMNINVQEEPEVDIGEEIGTEVKEEIAQMISSYKPDKVKSTNLEMKIVVKSEESISSNPRRLPFIEREIVDKQVEAWLEEGIIEPSNSEYSSQVVVARKKNGSPRICVDYRRINRVIVKDRFPIPLIEDQLDKLQEARIFSTLDLRNGFFHVDVEEQSRKYTAFVTHMGQYQFKKMPFGLCNSPAMFQRYINHIFRKLSNENVALPYMDDLIIPAVNEHEAIEKLKIVLEVAQDYGLEINKKKCHFLKKRIEFLGHVIQDGKIYPSPEKTQAVLQFPEPKTNKQIQSYLGLTGYFRKFIPYYSIVAKPLSDLLKQDAKFKFEEEERTAFQELKILLSNKPVLNIYRQGAEMELHTDASLEGYGAILFQKSPEDNSFHPVYYMSKKTSDAEKKYSSYELEVLAIIEALKKFRVYLLGYKFKIVTDCSAFTKTIEKKDLATRVARWAMLLEEYNYTIEHRSGSRMKHVDSLSRNPIAMIHLEDSTTRMKNAQDLDSGIRAIKEVLKEKPFEDYTLKNNILYKCEDGNELLVVPKSMQVEIIQQIHGDGHLSAKKVQQLIKQDYFIPQLNKKVHKCLSNCVPCILINRKRGKQEGYLHPINKEEIPLNTYHIDHLGPLESTNKNYKHILVVVDAFTKFVWLYPTKTTTARESISKLDLQKQVFGNPAVIISDRGTAFTAKEFKDYCEEEGIKAINITAGLPRSNGQVERVNSTIIPVLSKLCAEDPTKWYQYVGKVQQVLNSSYHRSINTTPFELLVGTKMREKNNQNIKQLIDEEMKLNFDETREELRKQAKNHILKIQEENKKYYNLRRRAPTGYKIDDLVAIKRTQFGPGLKLKSKFLGPYRVSKVKANNSYDVTKEGFHEGPICTSTCAEYMKPWVQDEDESSETDDQQEGRDVGSE